MVLLSTELISKTAGVNHHLLGLLLSIHGSAEHGIDLSLDGVDGALKSALGSHVAAVDHLHVVDSVASIGNLHLQLALGTLGAAKNAEEKSKKAMVDAARLADELRAEQDHASAQASSKQSLNNQFGQLEARLSDAENAAARGGKSAMAKLENKVCLWTCFGINDLWA